MPKTKSTCPAGQVSRNSKGIAPSEDKEKQVVKCATCGAKVNYTKHGTGICSNDKCENWIVFKNYSPVGAGENGMEAMKRAKTVGKGPYVGVKIADNIPTNPAPTSSSPTDEEIKKQIRKCFDVNGVIDIESIIAVIRANEDRAYQRGRDDVINKYAGSKCDVCHETFSPLMHHSCMDCMKSNTDDIKTLKDHLRIGSPEMDLLIKAHIPNKNAPRTYSEEDIERLAMSIFCNSLGKTIFYSEEQAKEIWNSPLRIETRKRVIEDLIERLKINLNLKSEADVRKKAVKEFCEKIRKILKTNKKRKSYLRFKKMSPYFRACVILDEAIKEARDGK